MNRFIIPCLFPVLLAGTPSPCAAQDEETSFVAPGESGETTILADNNAEFDSDERKAIFTGNVRVRDPEFYIQCDKLTVYVDEDGAGMERAEAEGNVRVTHSQKDDGDSPPTVGRGERLIYFAKTGEARLMGDPRVKEGTNLHLAADPSTVMVLNRDGRLVTEGASTTVIVPEGGTEDSRIDPAAAQNPERGGNE